MNLGFVLLAIMIVLPIVAMMILNKEDIKAFNDKQKSKNKSLGVCK